MISKIIYKAYRISHLRNERVSPSGNFALSIDTKI